MSEQEKKIQDWYNQFYQEIYQSSGDKRYSHRQMEIAQKDKMHLYYSPTEAVDFLMM